MPRPSTPASRVLPLASRVLPLASCFLLLLASGCAPPPMAAPPSPTATPLPAARLVATATVGPTSTPTPTALPVPPPSPGAIDLGLPVGDTYGIRGAAVDRRRGLLYVLGRDGDANRGGGVLTVVDLAAGQVRATAPLPAAFGIYGPTPSLALSPDGTRLYVAGGEQPALWVLDTGAAGADLGAAQASRPGVWSMILDSAGEHLYVVEGGHLRRLDAQTLDEELAAPLPDLPQYVTDVRLALDQPGEWLYLVLPAATSVAVYRAHDLSKAADIPIEQGATLFRLVSDPHRPRVYALTERYIESEPYTVNEVAVLQGPQLVASWAADENLQIGHIVSDDLSDRTLLLSEAEVRTVHPDSGHIVALTAVAPVSTFSVIAAFAWQGQLYRLMYDSVLASTSLDSGQTGPPTTLGITLVSAALDETAGRLFLLDSTGAIHVLDTASLTVTDTWPGVLDPGLSVIRYAPLTVAAGRLFVSYWLDDHGALVLDAASGQRLAHIPLSGQVTLDPGRGRLFISHDGVYLADASTCQVTGAIDDTVRQTQLVEPSAWATLYDSASDLLFVTMSNNSPGSSASTWLHLYDGQTLTRLESPIKTDQQFLSGLAVDAAAGRVWLASTTPFSPYAQTLAAFTLDGQLLQAWRGLAGQLFADTARERLIVARTDALFTLDTASGDLIACQPLDDSPETLLFDPQRQRLYATFYESADLRVLQAEAPPPAIAEPVGLLPAEPLRHLAVDADGAALAVSESGGLFRADGRGWLHLGGGLPQTGRPRLLAAPDAPGLLFAFTAEGSGPAYGLFRSTDGGRSWRPSSRGLRDFAIWDAALSPHFAADGLALLVSDAGLWRSTDGGESWTSLAEIPANHVALASGAGLRPDPTGAPPFLLLPKERQADGYPVYAPAADAAGVQDIGLIPISGPVTALALSPDFAADGLALIATWNEGLWRTQDGGRTWQPVGPLPAFFAPTTTILFSPRLAAGGALYVLFAPSYFGETDTSTLLRSSDGGTTWEMLAAGEPAEPRRWATMTLSPHDEGDDLLIGTADGQVLTLRPQQAAWQPAPRDPLTPSP